MALVCAAPDEREGPFSHQLQSCALPQPLPGPCSQGIWKGSFENQEKPLYITAEWTWVSSAVLQHLLQRLLLDFRGRKSIQILGVVGCMFPCSFAHHIFLTKCKISLSFHNLSLFLSFFLPPFLFFSLFNRFVFRSIRLVITRTQSSIFLLLERLLQCDGQIVRNNYTKWWQKIDRINLSLQVIRFI